MKFFIPSHRLAVQIFHCQICRQFQIHIFSFRLVLVALFLAFILLTVEFWFLVFVPLSLFLFQTFCAILCSFHFDFPLILVEFLLEFFIESFGFALLFHVLLTGVFLAAKMSVYVKFTAAWNV